MKLKLYLPLILIGSSLISACDENNIEPLCIEGPKGTIDENAYNFSLGYYVADSVVNNLEYVKLIYSSEEIDITLPKDGTYFTPWVTLPSYDFEKVEVKYKNEVFETIPTTIPETRSLVISIFTRDNVNEPFTVDVRFNDYDGNCNDVIDTSEN